MPRSPFDDVFKGEVLVMAPWLQGIGYGATLAKTGFPHLGGASLYMERHNILNHSRDSDANKGLSGVGAF
ncbi:MAG: hypothetical protein ACYCWN_12815 [Ferrimicrobium sp.]